MKTKFISEIASSHKGQKKILINLSVKHLKTKSNYLKYQIFKTKNLYHKSHKNFKRFKKLEISLDKVQGSIVVMFQTAIPFYHHAFSFSFRIYYLGHHHQMSLSFFIMQKING